MSLTRIGSIGINTGIAFAGVTTIVTLNTANDALSIGATVNVGSGITLGASGDIFATGVSTVTTLKVGSGVTASSDGDIFATGVTTSTTFSGAFSGSGANITALNASNLASGTVPTARLGSGTASSSTFLRGDSTFAAVTSTTINNNANNRIITGSDTANTLEAEANLTYNGTHLTTKGSDSSTSANAGGTGLLIQNTNNTNNNQNFLGFYDSTGTSSAAIIAQHENHSSTTGNLQFGTRNAGTYAERLRIDSGGKVHIGLTNGSGQFNVKNQNDSSTNALEIYNDNGVRNASFSQNSSGDATLDLRTNSASQTVLLRSNGISHFSGGEFGINTTAPVEKLGISGNMRFVNATGNTSRITALASGSYNVGNSGGSAICFQRFSDAGGGSDEIFFETHHQGSFHGETFRIEKTGDIKVKRGDLYFETAGKGIVLGATSNTDANTLDDYEEGGFTPVIKFGQATNNQSYNYQMGRYTKIGNRVVFHLYVAFTNKGTASGSARIYGLPFTSANVGVGYAHCSCWVNTSNFGNTTPTGYVPPNTDYFHIERQRTDGVGVYSCDNTNFNNTTDMMVAGSYIV